MKRSPELAALSREHQHALALALALRRASARDAEQLRREAIEFFRTEGSEHFRLEEEVLAPALARRTAPDDPGIVRMLVEHVELRMRFAALADAGAADPGALSGLGELLAAHTRFEDRELFVTVESELDAEQLASVGDRLRAGSSHGAGA